MRQAAKGFDTSYPSRASGGGGAGLHGWNAIATACIAFCMVAVASSCSLFSHRHTPSGSTGTTSASGSSIPPFTPAVPVGRMTWIINSEALNLIASSQSATSLLNSPRTYVIVPPDVGSAAVPPGWDVTLTASFTSYQKLSAALANGLPSEIKAVLYDDERWRHTPKDEQLDPTRYIAMAGDLVHSYGLQFIAAPAVNLVNAADFNPGNVHARFVNSGVLAVAAQHADVVDIQAQGSESSASTYSGFVAQAAAQVREAKPSVRVVAGISSNPSSGPVSLVQLEAAASSVASSVRGFWLNIPRPGSFCPNCPQQRPDLAVGLLEFIQQSGSS